MKIAQPVQRLRHFVIGIFLVYYFYCFYYFYYYYYFYYFITFIVTGLFCTFHASVNVICQEIHASLKP